MIGLDIHLRCESTVENTCMLEMWINGGEHTHMRLRCESNGGEHMLQDVNQRWKMHTWDVNRRWRTHACLRCESMVENTHTCMLEMWINGGEHMLQDGLECWWNKPSPKLLMSDNKRITNNNNKILNLKRFPMKVMGAFGYPL